MSDFMVSEDLRNIMKDAVGELRSQFFEKIQKDVEARLASLRSQVQNDFERKISDMVASAATRMEKNIDASIVDKLKIVSSLENRLEISEKKMNASLLDIKNSLVEILSEKELETQNKMKDLSNLIDTKVYESNSHLIKGVEDLEKLLNEKVDDLKKYLTHDIEERLDENRVNYEKLENRLDVLQNDLGASRNSLEKLESGLYSTEAELANLIDEKLSKTKMTNTELADNFDVLNKKFANLKTDVDSKVNRVDLDNLSRTIRNDTQADCKNIKASVEKLSSDLYSLESEFTSLVDEKLSKVKTDSSEIANSIEVLNKKLAGLKLDVDSKIDRSYLDNFVKEMRNDTDHSAEKLRKTIYEESKATLDSIKNMNREEILGEVHKMLKENIQKSNDLMRDIDARVVDSVIDMKNQMLLYKTDVENINIRQAEMTKNLRDLDSKLNQSTKDFGNTDRMIQEILSLKKDAQEKTSKINSLIDVFNTSQTKFVSKLIDLENRTDKMGAELYGQVE